MVKIQIVILKPEGAIHAQCFAELAETLSVACSELGYESSWGYNKFDTEATNIVFGGISLHSNVSQMVPLSLI